MLLGSPPTVVTRQFIRLLVTSPTIDLTSAEQTPVDIGNNGWVEKATDPHYITTSQTYAHAYNIIRIQAIRVQMLLDGALLNDMAGPASIAYTRQQRGVPCSLVARTCSLRPMTCHRVYAVYVQHVRSFCWVVLRKTIPSTWYTLVAMSRM